MVEVCMPNSVRAWPTSIGEQTQMLNHLKVLYSKGMVLNVQAKGSGKTESGECIGAEFH
jgi:hypothetical protein